MSQQNKPRISTIALMIAIGASVPGWAQVEHIRIRPPAPNIIFPPGREHGLNVTRTPAIRLTSVEARIDILEFSATTTIEVRLENTTGRRQEAELLLPVPAGAVVRGFAYDGPQGLISAEVLPKAEARRIYRDLVNRMKDPALVEFVGYLLIRSSVFPVEPHGKQKVRLTYEHLMSTEGPRVDYVLPRTESLAYAVPWTISAKVKAKQAIATVYSSSHEIVIDRQGSHDLSVRLTESAQRNPGAFRLSILHEDNEITASLYAYPDKSIGGGYFLLLAGLPRELSTKLPEVKRDVTLVIDRSGSMRGDKLAQVKEAALQILAGLKPGEAFNILIYSNTVEHFSPQPVTKTPETEKAAHAYLNGLTAVGGTNIHDALRAALQQKPNAGSLGITLFLTDGLPTIGQTSEKAIGDLVAKNNPTQRRVFTFGVGYDVNGPLLRKLAEESRAKATFVLPQEDVEVKVGQVFESLTGPLLASPKLTVVDSFGKPAPGRTRDILPAVLPDLFVGDRLILLGQYVGQSPLTFRIKGDYRGQHRAFDFKFSLDQTDPRNGFVARLWASRKIAELIDIVRQMGAEPGVSSHDQKIKELTDEIVRLSTEFGILTEYTAFLAREGTDLQNRPQVQAETQRQLRERAMGSRSGAASMNQSLNLKSQKGQAVLNLRNSFLDQDMQEVQHKRVQQINDRTFYQQGARWVDSRLMTRRNNSPDRTVIIGSDAYMQLAEELARVGRQGSLIFAGEVLLLVDGEIVLVKN